MIRVRPQGLSTTLDLRGLVHLHFFREMSKPKLTSLALPVSPLADFLLPSDLRLNPAPIARLAFLLIPRLAGFSFAQLFC